MTDELGKVIERLEKVSHYFKSELKVGNDGDAEIYTEHLETIKSAIRLLKWQGWKEQTYINELFKRAKERDKLLKELGRVDEHEYKDGSFMAGGSGIVKL